MQIAIRPFTMGHHKSERVSVWNFTRRSSCPVCPAAIRCFALDITDETERKQLEMALAEEKPDVKFLVNAAGFGKIGNVGDLSEGDECGTPLKQHRRQP